MTGSPLSMAVDDPRKRMSIGRNSMRVGTVGRSTWSVIETQGATVNRDLVSVHIIGSVNDVIELLTTSRDYLTSICAVVYTTLQSVRHLPA